VGGHHHHHSTFFDPYSRINGPVHRLPAGAKLAAAVLLIGSIVTLPVNVTTLVTFYPAVILFLVAVLGLSFIPATFVIKRLLVLEPVVLLAAAMALWQPAGARVFAAILLRSTLCIAVVILLSNTTPFPDLLGVLRRIRMPAILVTTLALMYRYLSVLVDESQRMRRARASRTFVKTSRGQWIAIGATLGQLFVRTGERADQIYAAMCARGWR